MKKGESNFVSSKSAALVSFFPVLYSDVGRAQKAGNCELGHHRLSLGNLLVFWFLQPERILCSAVQRNFRHDLSIAPSEELSWGVSFPVGSQEGQGLHVYFSGAQIWCVLLLFSLRLVIYHQVPEHCCFSNPCPAPWRAGIFFHEHWERIAGASTNCSTWSHGSEPWSWPMHMQVCSAKTATVKVLFHAHFSQQQPVLRHSQYPPQLPAACSWHLFSCANTAVYVDVSELNQEINSG